jgi:hypothetical protein
MSDLMEVGGLVTLNNSSLPGDSEELGFVFFLLCAQQEEGQ